MVGLSVLIPSKNLSLLSRAVSSITRTHKLLSSTEVIVIDDGLEERPRLLEDLRYVNGVKPFCFAANINIGIRSAVPTNDVFLMNDDTFFITQDSLRKLGECALSRSRLGVVTPVFARLERTPCQRLGHLDPGSGLWVERTGYLTFAGAYIRRSLLDLIGLLDDSFTGYGYEDNDFCLRAILSGYEIGVLPSAVMAHGDASGRSSLSFSTSDVREKIYMNRNLFIRKWGAKLLGLDTTGCDDLIRLIGFL